MEKSLKSQNMLSIIEGRERFKGFRHSPKIDSPLNMITRWVRLFLSAGLIFYACIVGSAVAEGSSYFVLCASSTLCPNVGDVCDDGNAGTTNDPIFAGCASYGGTYEPLFVTDDNQSLSSQWKTSTGVDDIAVDHFDDGKLNVAQITVSTTFPAFKLCDDLTDGGFTDWYLPARSELDVLWQKRTAIDANAAGNFTTSYYWSSTENITSNAWRENFSNGFIGGTNKASFSGVRCVRRN